jgi:replicative DNA helicase
MIEQPIEQPFANIEAEAALLGGLMANSKLIDGVADTVAADDFFEPLHGRVFSAIVGLASAGKLANPVTLRPYFETDPEMAELGGPAYLAQLTGSGAAVIGARDFAAQVKELAQRRRFVEGLTETIAAADDYQTSLEDLSARADAAISDARDSAEDAGEYSGAEALGLVIDGFDEPVMGTLCGVIPSMDSLLGPMRPTHMVVGAGRPGMGKTATAISYALGAAEKGHGVLFISLEMDAEQLGERMAADLCLSSRIPYESIRDRTLTAQQRMEVCRARDRISAMPLQILDKQGLRLSRLRTLVRRWARRFAARGHKLELVIVDYLQLLRADRNMDRYEAVSEISRTLKEIAKEQRLAVFALAQLSRKVEERADKRPMLSDLRESGQIEQDADAVLFFLRQEYYLQNSEPDPGSPDHGKWEEALRKCQARIEFICAKRRNGQAGSRVGEFLGAFQAVRG